MEAVASSSRGGLNAASAVAFAATCCVVIADLILASKLPLLWRHADWLQATGLLALTFLAGRQLFPRAGDLRAYGRYLVLRFGAAYWAFLLVAPLLLLISGGVGWDFFLRPAFWKWLFPHLILLPAGGEPFQSVVSGEFNPALQQLSLWALMALSVPLFRYLSTRFGRVAEALFLGGCVVGLAFAARQPSSLLTLSLAELFAFYLGATSARERWSAPSAATKSLACWSFGMYLWHMFVFDVAVSTVEPTRLVLLLILPFSALFGIASYALLERAEHPFT
jgi:peptidoglycan/LPS O-acetylase OafA/YrhL